MEKYVKEKANGVKSKKKKSLNLAMDKFYNSGRNRTSLF